MPIGNVTPAYWILPAQVVRSAQYGCNCRGEGGQGGCGELDVAEVLGGSTATPAHPMQATTTIYSFQGVTNGGTSYFQRPVYETATFIVIFDAPSRSIAMRRLGATDFDFAAAIPSAVVGAVARQPGHLARDADALVSEHDDLWRVPVRESRASVQRRAPDGARPDPCCSSIHPGYSRGNALTSSSDATSCGVSSSFGDGQVVLELLLVLRPDDDRRHVALRQQPRERHLRHAHAARVADLLHRVDAIEGAVLVHGREIERWLASSPPGPARRARTCR